MQYNNNCALFYLILPAVLKTDFVPSEVPELLKKPKQRRPRISSSEEEDSILSGYGSPPSDHPSPAPEKKKKAPKLLKIAFDNAVCSTVSRAISKGENQCPSKTLKTVYFISRN